MIQGVALYYPSLILIPTDEWIRFINNVVYVYDCILDGVELAGQQLAKIRTPVFRPKSVGEKQ